MAITNIGYMSSAIKIFIIYFYQTNFKEIMPTAKANHNSLRNPKNVREPKPVLFPKSGSQAQAPDQSREDGLRQEFGRYLDIKDMYPKKVLEQPQPASKKTVMIGKRPFAKLAVQNAEVAKHTHKRNKPPRSDEERNRLVLSHRRALVERKMNRLEVGEVVVGTVRGIKPYGAFIDIGGVSGLLHISEISHEHIETPHSVLNVNDQMKVMIIDLDAERGRISLSTKALEREPGDMLTDPQKVFEKAEEMAARYKQMLMEQAEEGEDPINSMMI